MLSFSHQTTKFSTELGGSECCEVKGREFQEVSELVTSIRFRDVIREGGWQWSFVGGI